MSEPVFITTDPNDVPDGVSEEEFARRYGELSWQIPGVQRGMVDPNADWQFSSPISSAVDAVGDFFEDSAHAFARSTWAGQLARNKILPDSPDFLDPVDPDFNVFDELTEAELRNPEFMDEAAGILRQAGLDRLRAKMQWNAYHNLHLSNAGGIAQFLGAAIDLDVMAPFGIPTKVAGKLKTALSGGAIVGGTTLAVETGRVATDPEASASELYMPVAASSFLGFALGGLIGKPLNGQNAARVINASNKVVDSGELSAVKAAAGDVQRTMDSELDAANNVTAEEIRKRYLKPEDTDEVPFSGGDESAAAPAPKPETPSIVKERGRWQPAKNAITTAAAKIGTQFPYFRVLENKLYGIPETNKLADELSEEMHRLAGTPTLTEGGGMKPGVDIMQQQYSGLYDQAMRSASRVYREDYRGNRPGGEGALRMAAMQGKDFITNTADRLRGNEVGVPFKVTDFYNWMAYASAHNRKFDASVNETETIRDLFREKGWGEAEWATVVKGLDRIQDDFLNKIGDELSAERMIGTDGAVRRAEVAEEVAANYDKRAGTLKTEMEKLPDGDSLKGLLKSITDDLEVRADAQRSNAMHEMLAAGDPETAMRHMLKLVSITLKRQLGSTRGRSDLEGIKDIRDDLAAAIERIKALEGMKVLDRADLENAIQIMDRVQKSLPGTSRSVRNKNFEDEPWAYEYKEMKADLDHGLKQVEHAENKNLKDMPRKDENYFPRLNRADRIDQNRGGLKELVIKRMQEDPQVRGRPTSLAAEDIAERAENVIENMRGRAIRVDTEGVMDARRPGSPSNVISRQSPLYDRDLLGRSPEESFIETDIRQVLQAYINRVGPAISMTKEYGDSSMFRQLISMDEKIDNAMLDAVRRGDSATATAIRKEGDAILESFKDMRSGVLKTRGFHEDPSTLSYRAIRVLKNAGIASLMGRAGQLAAADMGRLGLAMQMRDMIALASAKWNNPEEVGMAWAQAQLAGDVSETAISARAAATHDIGGGAYNATKFERFMEKSATTTFIGSGLTPFTDALKGIVSIFTHSEILRLSQAASEGTIRLMDRELPKQIGEYLLRPKTNILSGRNKKRIGAQHSRKDKIIEYDEALIRSQFKEKVWMTPRIKGVDALPASAFKDPEHWFRFNLMHEWMHAKYPKRTGEATAAYENRMNREAMRRMPFLDLPKKNQPTMLERLRRFGVEEEDAIALNAEWQKHGGAGPSIEGSTHRFLNVAETEKWTDARLRNLFRGAVSHEARQIITTPTIATKPMFMDNNLWSYLLQFQNFPITATFTSTARMFQTPKEKAMHRMVAGMLMGGYFVQNLRSGDFDTDFTDQALRAVDYSGVIPLIFSANNIAEIGLGIGLRPLLSDSESVMRDVSPLERAGPLVGPFGGNILRALGTLPEGEAADITKGLMRLSPFANLWMNPVPPLMIKSAEIADDAGN